MIRNSNQYIRTTIIKIISTIIVHIEVFFYVSYLPHYILPLVSYDSYLGTPHYQEERSTNVAFEPHFMLDYGARKDLILIFLPAVSKDSKYIIVHRNTKYIGKKIKKMKHLHQYVSCRSTKYWSKYLV